MSDCLTHSRYLIQKVLYFNDVPISSSLEFKRNWQMNTWFGLGCDGAPVPTPDVCSQPVKAGSLQSSPRLGVGEPQECGVGGFPQLRAGSWKESWNKPPPNHGGGDSLPPRRQRRLTGDPTCGDLVHRPCGLRNACVGHFDLGGASRPSGRQLHGEDDRERAAR